ALHNAASPHPGGEIGGPIAKAPSASPTPFVSQSPSVRATLSQTPRPTANASTPPPSSSPKPTPVPTPPPPPPVGPQLAGCPMFPTNNIWNTDISALPVNS